MNGGNYLSSARKQFEYYKLLGDRSFLQVSDDDLFRAPSPESNTIAVIVNHLAGNMLSRWTDFLTADGEKAWRHRDTEFEDVLRTRQDLLDRWEAGWAAVFTALDSIGPAEENATVYIRGQAHTIPEAVNRQLCHYAYHVGQITYLARWLVGEGWESLSIPRGQSRQFNARKTAKGKHGGHFTDDFR